MVYGVNNLNTEIKFENHILKVEGCSSHVGQLFGPDVKVKNVINCQEEFIARVNYLMSTFRAASYKVKYNLFKSYCMSLYGSVLWDYSASVVHNFYKTWRRCVRMLVDLPPRTHSIYISHILDDLPIETQLHKRFLKFLNSVLLNDNALLVLCGKLSINGSKSNVCNSFNFICHKYNIKNKMSMFSNFGLMSEVSNQLSEPDQINISNIKDILYIRDSMSTNFSKCELNDLINYFAVN